MDCFLNMINSLDKGTRDNRSSTWNASGCAGKGVRAWLSWFASEQRTEQKRLVQGTGRDLWVKHSYISSLR